jgi:predicted kinase
MAKAERALASAQLLLDSGDPVTLDNTAWAVEQAHNFLKAVQALQSQG